MTDRTTVIGTGAVGSAVARALLDAGRRVTVWNRTPERARLPGADIAPSPREAAADAELVLLTVPGHAAVADCLDALGAAVSGRTLVTLGTGTPDEARHTAARVTELGGAHLDAGLQASPDAIGTPEATLLFSGDHDRFVRHQETLETLGRARFVGETPEAASTWDLTLFGLWYDAQLGLLRALDLVQAGGGDPRDFAEAAAAQLGHVVTAAGATADELSHREYPAGPAPLDEHLPLLRQLVAQRTSSPLGDGGLSVAADRVALLVEAGRGGDGMSAVADEVGRTR